MTKFIKCKKLYTAIQKAVRIKKTLYMRENLVV